jgi:hypothetical protein
MSTAWEGNVRVCSSWGFGAQVAKARLLPLGNRSVLRSGNPTFADRQITPVASPRNQQRYLQITDRPVFAPETREQNVSKRGERDERVLFGLRFFAERSLHTGEVVGSIPTAPTTKSSELLGFSANHQNQLATVRDATKREHDGSSWGKSGDFDHRSFEMRVGNLTVGDTKNALVRAKQRRGAVPSRRADPGRDCGAAEVQRIAENASRWSDMNLATEYELTARWKRGNIPSLRERPPTGGSHSQATSDDESS